MPESRPVCIESGAAERRAHDITDVLWDTFGFHGKSWDTVYRVVLGALEDSDAVASGQEQKP